MVSKKAKDEMEALILEKREEGKMVFFCIDTVCVADVEESIYLQPVEGLLWDINRLPETTLTLLDDSKRVNDFAVYLIIERLKKDLQKTLYFKIKRWVIRQRVRKERLRKKENHGTNKKQ